MKKIMTKSKWLILGFAVVLLGAGVMRIPVMADSDSI